MSMWVVDLQRPMWWGYVAVLPGIPEPYCSSWGREARRIKRYWFSKPAGGMPRGASVGLVRGRSLPGCGRIGKICRSQVLWHSSGFVLITNKMSNQLPFACSTYRMSSVTRTFVFDTSDTTLAFCVAFVRGVHNLGERMRGHSSEAEGKGSFQVLSQTKKMKVCIWIVLPTGGTFICVLFVESNLDNQSVLVLQDEIIRSVAAWKENKLLELFLDRCCTCLNYSFKCIGLKIFCWVFTLSTLSFSTAHSLTDSWLV